MCTARLTKICSRDLEGIQKEYPSLNRECILAYLSMHYGHYEVEFLLGEINDFVRNFEVKSALRYYGKIEDYGNDLIAVYYEDLDEREEYKWLKTYGAEMFKYIPDIIYSEYASIKYGISDYTNDDLVVVTEEVVNNPSKYENARAFGGYPCFRQFLKDVRKERLVESISNDLLVSLVSFQTNGMNEENTGLLHAVKSSWKDKLCTLPDNDFEETFSAGIERFERFLFNASGSKRTMATWYNQL